jgi:MPBQ/MSBQ methyltransferase
MPKTKVGTIARSVARRLVHPGHLARAIHLQRARKRNKRAFGDAQLALLARVVPSGYLHYGYFDDIARQPEDISLAELMRAQHRYADLLMELAGDPAHPVLDIGCGMGGLLKLLQARGYRPTALTPDRLGADHVARAYPDVPVIRSKFEQLPDSDQHAGRYGTVVTSESLQYLKLDAALPLLRKILRPDGVWVACDYFRTTPLPAATRDKSGHDWEAFIQSITARGWAISYQRDITAHILPTLRYIHMWATQFGLPLLQFARLKMQAKQPALHYLLEEALTMIDHMIDENLQIITPAAFAAQKRYVLLALRPQA